MELQMAINDSTISLLNKPVTYYEKPGPGTIKYKYAKTEDIIHRLNQAFSYSWSTMIVDKEVTEDFVVLLVRLTVNTDTETIQKEAYGGAKVLKSRDNNTVIDLGNAYKSAFANAIKGAAKQFGVGLNDSEDEEDNTTYQNSENVNYSKFQKPSSDKRLTQSPVNYASVKSSTTVKIEKDNSSNNNDAFKKARQFLNTNKENLKQEVDAPVLNNINEENPFPVNQELSVTDIQIAAIQKLCSFTNKSEEELILEARNDGILRDSVKSLRDFTQKEGAAMIRFLMHKKSTNA